MRRALIFGFLAWLVPFVISVAIYRIRESDRPLFESIMAIVVAGCASLFLNLYFRKVEQRFAVEGMLLGLLWCAMSVALDLPLFSYGPMKMPLAAYLGDIGVAYLVFPAVCIPTGLLLDFKTARTA